MSWWRWAWPPGMPFEDRAREDMTPEPEPSPCPDPLGESRERQSGAAVAAMRAFNERRAVPGVEWVDAGDLPPFQADEVVFGTGYPEGSQAGECTRYCEPCGTQWAGGGKCWACDGKAVTG